MEKHKQMQVKIYSESGNIPKYATPGSACFDIEALIKPDPEYGPVDIHITPGESAIIDTGLYFEIPEGYVLKIYPRSGSAFKYDVSLSNCVPIIDSDFRSSVKLKIINHGHESFIIENGDRVAQAMVEEVIPVDFIIVDKKEDLSKTDRGEGGFGSTGIK